LVEKGIREKNISGLFALFVIAEGNPQRHEGAPRFVAFVIAVGKLRRQVCPHDLPS
jgi:hypothetical protein